MNRLNEEPSSFEAAAGQVGIARLESFDRKGLRRVVTASMAGTIVEWYEFFLYATAATLVFNHLFFPPSSDPYMGVIAAFTTYAVGFLARPLGGIIFAHFGDRYGRKSLLQVAIVMVGTTTFLMGCLPGFSSIGYWAPALLVVLRFLQGIAVGGEWGGAVLLVAEHSPSRSRAFWASWPQAALPLGNLLATIVLLVLSVVLSDEAFLSWGWRVGFWLSVVIVAIGYYIRTKVEDAPIFQQAQQERTELANEKGFGVFEVLRAYPRGVLTAMGIRFGENILYYMVVTFSITYLKISVDMQTSDILGLIFIAHATQFVVIPLVGKLADITGRKPTIIIGCISGVIWAFSFFKLLDTANDIWVFVGIVWGLTTHAFMYAAQPAVMSEMFPTRMRYAGVSFGYQVTSIVAGSVAPIIATALLSKFGSPVPISVYITIAVVVTLIATISLRETRGVSFEDLDRKDRERVAVLRATS